MQKTDMPEGDSRMYIIKTKSGKLPFYFPLTTSYSRNMPYTPHHSHDCIEIGIILKGCATHECGSDVRELHPGDVIVIQPLQTHAFPDTRNLNMFNILFHPFELNMPLQDMEKLVGFNDLIPQNRKQPMRPFLLFHLEQKEFQHSVRIINLMRAEKNEIGRSGYRSAMLGLFMNLLCHLIRSYSAGLNIPQNRPQKESIEMAVKYLNKHYLENFDLKNLLKISAMSRSSFMTHFRNITGYSPKQHMIRKRIAYAVSRMTEKKLTLTEIAIECGFHDSSHFYKSFLHITGETPRTYRLRITTGSDVESFWTKRNIINSFVHEELE